MASALNPPPHSCDNNDKNICENPEYSDLRLATLGDTIRSLSTTIDRYTTKG
ncbi:uncharacterized protein AB675_7241 [Cyphellophora attinorum]|uniref:Uncharacterized protein n=1 Tax=Cyphellophora attinorum TaxID=1664694 RepID=A0A0N0NHT4_9EURO|nr:uncharacterized protein AB675_7241 [Phialophora attinorum]KPI35051.1 hypothetical protein AB675_7241 [Phialophora attinorum]